MAGVYWVGADGNAWYKGDNGQVSNMGKYLGGNDSGFDSNRISQLATRIDDPNAPAKVLGDATGGGAPAQSSAPQYPALNSGAVHNTQRAIDQIPDLLDAALQAEGQKYKNTLSGYNASETAQRGTYDKSTTTNQQNYDGNYMDSIRAGIHGLGGLINLLRGTGAAGGTAEDMVRDTVGGVTADDIRGGADTRDQNQGSLDSALTTFLTELKGKRQMADDTHDNNESAVRRDSQTQLQDLYSKMAGYYGDAGQTSDRNTWMDRAGDLTPKIAGNSKAVVSAYDRTPVVVKAPDLTAFAAPSQPNVAAIPQDGQVGSGIFTMNSNKKRDEQTAPVALPAGA